MKKHTVLKGKIVSLKDSLDGCERILRDEFKDYPESALYMIGAIGEAKKKAPPDKPEAKADPNPAADYESKAKSEPQPKPKPEVEHAAADTHAS